MKQSPDKFNIRYLGFESLPDGGRRLDFSITAHGRETQRASFEVPFSVFTGSNRVSFQESAALCYEKLRYLIEREDTLTAVRFKVTEGDIETFRPRRRAAARNKA